MTAAPIKNAPPVHAGEAFKSNTKVRKSAADCTPTADTALDLLHDAQAVLAQMSAAVDRLQAGLAKAVRQ